MAEQGRPVLKQERSVARLTAIQALYQMDVAATDLTDVLAERVTGLIGRDVEGEALADLDFPFFKDLVEGVVREQGTLDPVVDEALAEGWTLGRVDSTLRAILRAGAFELSVRRDVPYRVTISEYVDIAHAFFEGPEPKVVNAVLDKLARLFHRDDPAFDKLA